MSFEKTETKLKAEIINQPYSGEFKKRIYDVESPWNSQSWTWIKFTDENMSETVGQFRGFPKEVKYSESRNEIDKGNLILENIIIKEKKNDLLTKPIRNAGFKV